LFIISDASLNVKQFEAKFLKSRTSQTIMTHNLECPGQKKYIQYHLALKVATKPFM